MPHRFPPLAPQDPMPGRIRSRVLARSPLPLAEFALILLAGFALVLLG